MGVNVRVIMVRVVFMCIAIIVCIEWYVHAMVCVCSGIMYAVVSHVYAFRLCMQWYAFKEVARDA